MLTRLAFAQWRAYRAATVWTAALMTTLVALLTAVVIFGATEATLDADAARINGNSRENNGNLTVNVDQASLPSGFQNVVSPTELESLLEGAHRNDVVARATGFFYVPAPGSAPQSVDQFPIPFIIQAVYGEPVPTLLGSGTWPEHPGEIALAAQVARQLGAHVGDVITLDTLECAMVCPDVPVPHSLKVVGIATASSLAGYDLALPSGYVSWAEATQPGGVLLNSLLVDSDGTQHEAGGVEVRWDGFNAPLARYGSESSPIGQGTINLPNATVAWLGAAGALFVAMIVMAFAVGRNQAATRTQWVATARVMGARRSSVVAAALVEAFLLAAIALVVGTALGIGIAQAQLMFARAYAVEPFGPNTVTLHWAIVPVVVSVTTVMALVIAAVPAFWAARVSPTAALKPVSDLTESEVSRRVHARWLVALMLVGVAMVAVGSWAPSPLTSVAVLGWVTVVVTEFTLVVEWLRRLIPATGRSLGRTKRASLMAAGDALATRPRQAVAPALLMTVATALVTLWASGKAASEVENWRRGADGAFAAPDAQALEPLRMSLWGPTVAATLVVTALALQLVVVAIVVSTRAATAAEAKALRALGLSHRVEAAAAWWQQWLPQAIGAGVGVGVGVVTYAASASSTASYQVSSPWPFIATSTGIGAAYGIVASVAALVLAALVAALMARMARPTRPSTR